MQFNFPWIISRRYTLIFALIDFFLVFNIYNYSFFLNFNSYPNNNVKFSLAFFWIIISYIVGRYSKEIKNNTYSINKLLIRIIIIWLIVNFIYLAINLSLSFLLFYFSSDLINNSLDRELIQFFLRSSFIFSTASFLINIFVLYLNNKFNKKSIFWLYIGNETSFSDFIRLIKVKSVNYNFKRITKIESIQESDIVNLNGIIISDKEELISENYQFLLHLRRKQVIIIGIQEWFENYLFRINPALVKNELNTINKFYKFQFNYQMRIKRVGDLIVSSLLLIFSSPILIIISLLIFLEDRGPVFYTQIRNGYNGKNFRIIKFRSMNINAEKDGPKWAQNYDPRITKIGKFIRALRIDELPQLFCVLNGTMSLIGPRPERPEIEENLLRTIPNYKLRNNVLPGISGWAQVNYPYGASIFDSYMKLSYDLYYISNFSILFDFLILFKTLKIVFNAKGSKPSGNIII